MVERTQRVRGACCSLTSLSGGFTLINMCLFLFGLLCPDDCSTLLQGGGFCGTRTKPLNLNLSEYDGLQMRVKGDGQIFKFNIKTVRDSLDHSLPDKCLCTITNQQYPLMLMLITFIRNPPLLRINPHCRLTRRTPLSTPTRPPLTPHQRVTGQQCASPGPTLCRSSALSQTPQRAPWTPLPSASLAWCSAGLSSTRCQTPATSQVGVL